MTIAQQLRAVLLAVMVSLPAHQILAQQPAAATAATDTTTYAATLASLKTHAVPAWFNDAKFGIFVHWDLASYPGWAPTPGPLNEIIADSARGWKYWFANNPYSDWYLNTLKIPGSPVQQHHAATYGRDFSFFDFAPLFNREVMKWQPDTWADLFQRAGAKYVVLTTKHHDGFLLWPSATPNPKHANYNTTRDVVGELGSAVRAKGLRYGLYYSGGLDWTFNETTIADFPDLFRAVPNTPEYTAYALAHYRELIDKYQPAVLWNDIAFPASPMQMRELWAYYYNNVRDGVINNRFNMLGQEHFDFTTPEYEVLPRISAQKWESTRGLGYSFGYNQNETGAEFLTPTQLIRSFVDIVSKNGNLLLNVGPKADGTIPAPQAERILAMGDWLRVNGAGIYGSRPWVVAEGTTAEKVPLRFTTRGDTLYAFLLGTPGTARHSISLEDMYLSDNATVKLLGNTLPLRWTQQGRAAVVTLPARLPQTPVHTLSISPIPWRMIRE